MSDSPSKVLVIGSGPIVIGQAAEFDYAGTQACKALREEGIITVLVNSNPATIMTDEDIADVVYVEPLTVPVLERVIEAERPDGILPTLGGQTGLNLAVDLADAGVLDRYNVRLLGTPLSAIRSAEDRELFRQLMADIGEPLPPNVTVSSVEDAVAAVPEIGLPLVVRPAYTLGGTGGGIAYTEEELREIVAGGIAASPIGQTLLEKALIGWKEIEYEVMRDGADNCITVCNMENIDPMGVHTGDSIVVAPSQTLSDKEYQALRTASLKIIRALGIEGGCNVQLALEPGDVVGETLPPGGAARRGGFETRPAQTSVAADATRRGGSETRPPHGAYYVIEVNPRVSRSSALASKATGYPIARVAAKVAIGKRLDEIPNAVTRRTKAAFEPALDYCVVKIPRWPFDKFPAGDRAIGTQMKATGEVMAIDRSFEAAFQKAVRSLEITNRSLLWEHADWTAEWTPLHPHDQRLWALLASLRRGTTADDLSRTTGIDPWFTRAFARIADMERRLLSATLTADLMWDAKRLGFSDAKIGVLSDRTPAQVRTLRLKWGIRPVYKMVDTCAAEFEAETPYFYSTYEQENEAAPIPGRRAVVIGSGPIRIGQGIEFDYCSVHAAWALQQAGRQERAHKLQPGDGVHRLRHERPPLLRAARRRERPRRPGERDPRGRRRGGRAAVRGAVRRPDRHQPLPVVGRGGPAHPGLDRPLDRRGIGPPSVRGLPLPGGHTQPARVGGGQRRPGGDRRRDHRLPRAGAAELRARRPRDGDRPEPNRAAPLHGGRARCGRGPPRADRQVLRGPRGRGRRRLRRRVGAHPRHHGARRTRGVHSGDSMAIYPGLTLTSEEIDTVVDYTTRIGRALDVRGLMNIQFVVLGGPAYRSPGLANGGKPEESTDVYVLEVNPRSSRTIPFISKVTGVPMVRLAINAMLGKSLQEQGYQGGLWKKQDLVGVKAPVFSMSKLAGVDTYLGPEMKSTGEVIGLDYEFGPAVTKALMAAGLMLPDGGAILLSIADRDKADSLQMVRDLAAAGYRLYATGGTAAMIRGLGIDAVAVPKLDEGGRPNVVDVIADGTVDAVVNTLTGDREALKDGFEIRREAVERRIPCFTSLDTARAAVESLTNDADAYNVKPLPSYRHGA